MSRVRRVGRDIINEAAPKQRHPNGFNPFLTSSGGLLLIELPTGNEEGPRAIFLRPTSAEWKRRARVLRDTLFAAKAGSKTGKEINSFVGRAYIINSRSRTLPPENNNRGDDMYLRG